MKNAIKSKFSVMPMKGKLEYLYIPNPFLSSSPSNVSVNV